MEMPGAAACIDGFKNQNYSNAERSSV